MQQALPSAFARGGLIRLIGCLFISFLFSYQYGQAQICDAEGGTLTFADDGTTTRVICADDGIPDPFTVNVDGANGQNQIFLVTDNYGNILANSNSPDFDFEGTGAGGCFIFNLAYSDGFEGDFAPGGNFCMFTPSDGCFDLSSYVLVIRRTGEDCEMECEAEGGDLTLENGETAITICADGEPDPFDVILENAAGTNMDYLITDLDGNILAFPAAPPFDLDPAGPGICLVWHISYEDEVTGLVEGGNAEDIDGCFSLSNFIQVTRYEAEGGSLVLEGGETDTTVCIDGEPDLISVVRTGETTGQDFTFVITDDELNILAIPDNNGPFDLEPAGPGTCLIWYLAFNDDIQGLEVGLNAGDLTGCFDFSSSITVFRNQPDAGEIQFEDGNLEQTICAGDGVGDPFEVVQLGEPVGGNFSFIVTDADGNILGLSASGPFDFDGAGPGACQIYYIAFEDGLAGLEAEANIADLMGCFDLSNSLVIFRNQPDAGMIEFEDGNLEQTICAGDSIPDPFEVVQTGDPMGSNFSFIVTDADGNILGLPDSGPFDFEGAGGGACQIYYIAFEDDLVGLETEANIADLMGCFSLSNALTITRLTGDDCDGDLCDLPDVPQISLGDTTTMSICVDSVQQLSELFVTTDGPVDADNFALILLDANGNGLNVAEGTLGPVDFSLSGVAFDSMLMFPYNEPTVSVVLVYYDDDANPFGILDRGCDEPCRLPVDSIGDCFAISNIIDIQIGDCDEPVCEVDAGSILFDDGLFTQTICAGDSIPDPYEVIQTGDPMGSNFSFIVTDADGTILGLPESGPFDFEGAGGGACQIYYIAFEDGLEGLQPDSSLNDLDGCFALSNPLVITRLTGEDCDMLDMFNFEGELSGTQEVPFPALTTAIGFVEASLDGNTLTLSGGFSGLIADLDTSIAGGVHIHHALAGDNGPVIRLIATDIDDDFRGGTFNPEDNTFELTDEELGWLMNRALYVNIHSTAFPGGELRAQLLLEANSYHNALLAGSNEVPSIVSPASGQLVFELRDNQLVVSGSFTGLTDEVATDIAGGAHIHAATNGRNGPVIFPLNIDLGVDATSAQLLPDSNTYVLSNDQILMLQDEMFYINVHSLAFMSGELRGQVTFIPIASFRAGLAGHQEVPAAVDTDANGRFTINYYPNGGITVSGSINDLESDLLESLANGAHLHQGPAGTNGPVAFPLNMNVADDLRSATLLPFDNLFFPDEDQLEALYAREFYVNVHSVDNQGGEVRGQVVPTTGNFFSAQLTGLNEADPNVSDAFGHAFGEQRGDQLVVTGSFADLESMFAAEIAGGAHLHIATAGENGPIGVPLNTDLAGDELSGTFTAAANMFTIDAATVDQLQAGDVYVNIHTDDFASGELRGQMLRDDNAFPSPGPTIIAPEENTEITVTPGDTDPLIAEFTSSSDPDGDDVYYVVEVTTQQDEDYEGSFILENASTGTSSATTLGQLFDTLSGAGFPIGATQSIRARVAVADGSVMTYGPDRIATITLAEDGFADGIMLNEVSSTGDVEIYNSGLTTVDLSGFYLFTATTSYRLGDINPTCGSLNLEGGKYLTIELPELNAAADELALFRASQAISGELLVAYVQWGQAGGAYEDLAMDAGIWIEGFAADAPTTDETLQYFDNAWRLFEPTLCSENGSPLSTGELNGPGSLRVYPNPASDLLTVETSAFLGQSGSLELYDLNGRLLQARELDQVNGRLELSLLDVAAGTYVLRVTSEQAIRVVKLNVR